MGSILPDGQLVVGMQLPIQSQSTIYVEPWETHAGAAELATIARAADDAGFFYVAVCDHVAIPADKAPAMGTEWWDTVATLGWLAGITTKIRLLSHVYVPAYRHPLQVAKAFATLDVVSGGRIVMGVGAGHVEAEFEMLGLSFVDRGRLLNESIDALRAAFAEDWATLPGPHWVAADMGQRPRPVQEDGPPIWIGGSSPAALRRAAQRGDGWLPQGPVTAEIVAQLFELRHAAGRHDRFDIGALMGSVYVGEPEWDLGGPALTGSPDKLIHVLNKLGAIGVGQAQIRLKARSAQELVDQIGQFGAEVLPHLVRPVA
ncbi:MAG: TIGR03619 family F420-dependent LLM class oxidoreductase [Aquihabitans sp.]